MNKTKIEWVQNPDGSQGYTWNPITGCLNGCDYCYARKLANTRLRERYLANKNIAIGNEYINMSDTRDKYQMVKFADDPFYPRFWPEKLLQPYVKGKSKGIFVCDMSDLFGIGIPDLWTTEVLNAIRACPQHRFYLLTKQPQNLAKFSPFPDNCWVGVSATNNYTYLGELQTIEAKVKYISFEPLLNWRKFPAQKAQLDFILQKLGVSWVIIGAQTKPTVMPEIEWVREIVQTCDKAGIPVFLKDNLEPLMGGYPIPKENIWAYKFDGGEFKLRQEMPTK